MSNTNDVMNFINSFSRLGKRVENLDRIKSLLDAIGNPQDNLKFIHIAGTNGKGSMAHMFNEIFVQQGYKTALFTSPYLIEYSDRIRINNENISQNDLLETVSQIAPKIQNHPKRAEFSQFEITQAIALTYFANKNCDIVILEAGLGGLLDSTNIIKNPIVTVIGSVSFDHTAILGETLEEIAFQKAGIIKPHCPCVLSPANKMDVIRTVREVAISNESMLMIPNLMYCTNVQSDIFGSKFSYRGEEYVLSLVGKHQVTNALTVLDAMRFVCEKMTVSQDSIKQGLKKATLFGRVEVLSKEPLTILDGGHNPDGTRALASVLASIDTQKITAVIGMHKDKNALDAIKNLVPYVDKFIAVDGFSDLDYDKSDLAKIITQAGGNAVCGDDICTEIDNSKKENNSGATIICGSLFLVAYVKTHYNAENDKNLT